MNRVGPMTGRGVDGRPRITFVRVSILTVLALVVGSWVFVLTQDRTQASPFFSVKAFGNAVEFVKELFGVGSGARPAFAEWEEWRRTGVLAYKTLAMSLLGIGIAVGIALATFMFGARNVMTGELAPYGSWVWRAGFFVTRAFFVFARGVPELVWALLLVFVFSPGILPGAIALGLHNAGILGKLSSEVVEGMDPSPMRALQSTGAGRFQVLAYGVLPQALPRFITYSLYRWEVIIRTTIVVGFVAAGGLGLEFRLSMSHFQFTRVALVLMWYLVLVVGVDLVSAWLRRLSRRGTP